MTKENRFFICFTAPKSQIESPIPLLGESLLGIELHPIADRSV